ncbi:MAG: carboxymuconolactone decarboxylase family protein [Pseudomonadota bacterium]
MLENDLLDDTEANPAVAAVFDDIRTSRGDGAVNNFWRALAHDPKLLEATWARMKATMMDSTPDGLDPFSKELVYLAVSIANGCIYCVHCHTAAARKLGMTEAQYADLLAVVAIASQTNALATELKVPVDDAYREPAE